MLLRSSQCSCFCSLILCNNPWQWLMPPWFHSEKPKTQRFAQDYTSGLSESQASLFLQSCQLPLVASLSSHCHLVKEEVEPADSVVPSSILMQGGYIEAEVAEITELNAFSSTEHSILSHVARSIPYLEFQFFFLLQLFLSRILSTFPN